MGIQDGRDTDLHDHLDSATVYHITYTMSLMMRKWELKSLVEMNRIDLELGVCRLIVDSYA